jgi:hypothetical protein
MRPKHRSLVAAVAFLGVVLSLCTFAARTRATPNLLVSLTATGNGPTGQGWLDCTQAAAHPDMLIGIVEIIALATAYDSNLKKVCSITDSLGSTQSTVCTNAAVLITSEVVEPATCVNCTDAHFGGQFGAWPNEVQSSPVTFNAQSTGSCANTTFQASAWGEPN